MAVRDAKTVGSTFLAEVIGKLPAALQAQAKTIFDAAEAAPAIEHVGNGALRQSDYSRTLTDAQAKVTEVETWKGSLDTWFESKKTDLEELAARRAGTFRATGDPVDPAKPAPVVPPVDTSAFVSRKDFESVMDQTERGAVAFFSELNRLGLQHYQQFNEVLDTEALMKDPRLSKGVSLREVYQDLHKEQIAAKAKAASDAAEAQIRKDEREKVQREMAGSQHPYPVRGNEPSTLDALEVPADKRPAVASVDDMAAELARLGGARAH